MSRRPRELAAAAAAPVFAALGDATRLSILTRLCEGQPQSIAQLTQGTGLSRQGVSKHLAVLEQAGVVACERVGRESRYAVQTTALTEVRHFLDRASQQWDDAIERLKRHIEK
jgi:DNA-binding transcriptional ArsR family regulator